MLESIKYLLTRSYQPLNIIELSKKNLIHNYKYLISLNKKIKVAPVLKSNAYGHGLVPVAKILEKMTPPFFCVDSLYEAYELTKNGIKTPILIMGFVDPISLKTKKLPYSFAVFNNDQITWLSKFQPGAKIHIFVDTGMHREGVLLHDLKRFVEDIVKSPKLRVEGLMSHFGEAENAKNPMTKLQINNFKEAALIIKTKWLHISNSAGVLNNFGIGNLARCGIATYGISPLEYDQNLKPVLTLKTHIAQVKKIKKRESVGYSFTFKAKKDMTIAILPIGYYDGVDRRISDKGFVKVGNVYCRIIGRISMNITTIDVSGVSNVKVGDEVIVYSNSRSDKNSIEKMSLHCSTIPYDLLVHLSHSTKRLSL